VIDAIRAGLSGKMYCSRLAQFVRETSSEKEKLFLLQDWKVVILHWDDAAMEEFLDCFRVTRLLDSTRIRRFKRSIVTGRKWNETTRFIERGRFVNYGNWRDHSGAPVQHINYGVRSDVVEGFQKLLLAQQGNDFTGQKEEQVMVRGLTRSTDVAHFWPLEGYGDAQVIRGKASRLRDAVSETIHTRLKNSSVFVGLTGEAQDAGRNQAQRSYLAKLFDSKIVVVSQKDDWEDHYRLMEAMVSGAMVMTGKYLYDASCLLVVLVDSSC
jgi:hypothetical protein